MVPVHYVVADEPAYGAADDYVRGKVLPGDDPGDAFARGEAVCREFRERAGIFLGDDGGIGPGDDAVA